MEAGYGLTVWIEAGEVAFVYYIYGYILLKPRYIVGRWAFALRRGRGGAARSERLLCDGAQAHRLPSRGGRGPGAPALGDKAPNWFAQLTS